MRVHEGYPDALPAVMTVFDSAMLETDAKAVETAIDGGDVLLATSEGRVLGACLLSGNEIDAIAVRPGRRGQGIGTALVDAAADRRHRLVAEFDPRVRPFWESLGFEVETVADGRLRGVQSGE